MFFFFFVRFSWGQILATWQENKEGAKGLERVFWGGGEKLAKLVTLGGKARTIKVEPYLEISFQTSSQIRGGILKFSISPNSDL